MGSRNREREVAGKRKEGRRKEEIREWRERREADEERRGERREEGAGRIKSKKEVVDGIMVGNFL